MIKSKTCIKGMIVVLLTISLICEFPTSVTVMANEADTVTKEYVQEQSITSEKSHYNEGGIGQIAAGTSEALGNSDTDRIGNIRLYEDTAEGKLYLSYDYKKGFIYYISIMSWDSCDGEYNECFGFNDEAICTPIGQYEHNPTTSDGTSVIDLTQKAMQSLPSDEPCYIYAEIDASRPNDDEEEHKSSSDFFCFDRSDAELLKLSNINYDINTGLLSWQYPVENPSNVYRKISIRICHASDSTTSEITVINNLEIASTTSISLDNLNNPFNPEEDIVLFFLDENNLNYICNNLYVNFGAQIPVSTLELKNNGCLYLSDWDSKREEYENSAFVLFKKNANGIDEQITDFSPYEFIDDYYGNISTHFCALSMEIVQNGNGEYYVAVIPYREGGICIRSNSITYVQPTQDIGEFHIQDLKFENLAVSFTWTSLPNAVYYYEVTQNERKVKKKAVDHVDKISISLGEGEDSELRDEPCDVEVYAIPENLSELRIASEKKSVNPSNYPIVTKDTAYIGTDGTLYAKNIFSENVYMQARIIKKVDGKRANESDDNDEYSDDLISPGNVWAMDFSDAIITGGTGEYYAKVILFTRVLSTGETNIVKTYRTEEFNYTEPESALDKPDINVVYDEENETLQYSIGRVQGAYSYPNNVSIYRDGYYCPINAPQQRISNEWLGEHEFNNLDDTRVRISARALSSDITACRSSEINEITVASNEELNRVHFIIGDEAYKAADGDWWSAFENGICMDVGEQIKLSGYLNWSYPGWSSPDPREISSFSVSQKWSSENKQVAEVSDDGTIKALASGTTTVKVRVSTVYDLSGGEVEKVSSIGGYEPSGGEEYEFTIIVKSPSLSGVTLDRESAELSVGGDSITLTAVPIPSGLQDITYTWKSSDTSVATVTDGVVTPVGEGSAVITVTAMDPYNVEKKATCNISVKNEKINVASVSLNRSKLDLQVGDTENLIATIDPFGATNQRITWSSDNMAVATVDETGRVAAVSPGTAMITVTTEDGSKTAACAVTVKERVILTGVQLSESKIVLSLKGNPVKITATPIPEDVEKVVYEWTSSDEKIITVKDGVLTPVAIGTATLTVTAKDSLNNSVKATADVTVTNELIQVTGITLNKSVLDLKIGETEKLNALIEPIGASDQKVTWKSDNNDVATVDKDGDVTGIAAGTTKISVITNDGGKTATCTVKITNNGSKESGRDPGLNVSEETVDKGVHYYDAYMVKGQTYVFPAKYGDINASSSKKEQTIAWKTSDKKTASVSGKNKVKAVNSTGSMSTVQIYDGATYASSEYVYRLHIVAPMIVEYGKTTQMKSISLTAGDDYTLAVAGLTGFEDKFNVTWLSSNGEIASVDNGIVSAAIKGSAKITAYVGGKAYSCNVKVVDARTIPKTIGDGSSITLSPLQTVSLKFSSTLFKAKKLEWVSKDGTLQPYNKNNAVASSTDKVSYFQNEVVRVTPSGKVTAVGVGSTTISASDQNGITQTVTITVPKTVSQKLSLNVNKTKQIKLYNVKANKATWSSSDSKVTGNIVKGKIQGVRYGTAEATCTYDPYNTGKPIEYKITIYVENPKLDTKDSAKWSKVNAAKTSGTLTLKAGDTYSVSLTDVYQDVVFTSNKPTVAFVDEAGNISVRDAGKAKLTAKVNGTSITINIVATK